MVAPDIDPRPWGTWAKLNVWTPSMSWIDYIYNLPEWVISLGFLVVVFGVAAGLALLEERT